MIIVMIIIRLIVIIIIRIRIRVMMRVMIIWHRLARRQHPRAQHEQAEIEILFHRTMHDPSSPSLIMMSKPLTAFVVYSTISSIHKPSASSHSGMTKPNFPVSLPVARREFRGRLAGVGYSDV